MESDASPSVSLRLTYGGEASASTSRGWCWTGNYRVAFYSFAAVAVGLFLLVNLHGPCTQMEYGHDDLGFLAAAWKVRCGILPHTGYHSALGALNPWIHAAGMWLLGPTADVLPFCNALVALALGFLAWVIARPRLTPILAALFAFTETAVAMTPHLLRFGYTASTYDGYYNRQCYALVSILMLSVMLSRRQREGNTTPRATSEAIDGWLAGLILAVLLFIKVSYFAVGFGLCGLSAICGRGFSRRKAIHCICALGLASLACLPLLGFDLPAMCKDLQMAAAARAGDPVSAFTIGKYLRQLPGCWLELAVLIAMQATLRGPWIRWPNSGTGTDAPAWAELAAVVSASLFIGMTNGPGGTRSETPLLSSWMFILFACASRQLVDGPPPGFSRPAARRWIIVGGLGCVLWVYTFGTGCVSLLWSSSPRPTRWQRAALHLSPEIDSDSLRGLRIYLQGGEPIPVPYAEKINDGLRLLRKLPGQPRVEAFDFVNPFPFALGWRPARGGLWCWHKGYSFSETAHPTADDAFGDADVLMVPKFPGEVASFQAMTALYGSYVREHFQLVDQSAEWLVLRRR